MISCYARKFLTMQPGYMRGASRPVLGAAHGTDMLDFLGLSSQTDFIAVDSISKSGSDSESGLSDQVGSLFCPYT